MKDVTSIIKRPLITEKGTFIKNLNNQVLFAVDVNANKIEIKQAVEKYFKVKVKDVRTVNVKGKRKRFGRHEYVKSDWKKAIVCLQEGETIELYEGV